VSGRQRRGDVYIGRDLLRNLVFPVWFIMLFAMEESRLQPLRIGVHCELDGKQPRKK
jgi:hypothetical protein